MNGIKIIEITVKLSGSSYIARTGRGGYARSASSTNSPYFAALSAAEKFLRPRPNEVVEMFPSLEENQHAGTYMAKLAPKKKEAAHA